MYNRPIYSIFVIVILFLGACKKDKIRIEPLASLRVVNAVPGGATLKVNSNVRDSAKNFNSSLFGIAAGELPLYIYPVKDSLHPYLNHVKDLENGGIFSAYFFGDLAKGVDVIWMKEAFAPYYTDSALDIRFVNLSVNAGPLSVTLASNPAHSLFTELEGKKVTAFVKLPLTANTTDDALSFQVRSADNNIVATYILPADAVSAYPTVSRLLSRFKRITIVIKGVAGATAPDSAIGLFPVPNY